MKFLLMMPLLVMNLACTEQELPEVTVQSEEIIETSQVNNDSEASDNNSDDEDDHSTPPPPAQVQPNVLRAAAMLSSSSESLQLGEKKVITISLMTDAEFEPGPLNVSLNRDSIESMDPGTYIQTTLSQEVVNLDSSDSRDITLEFDIKTMAPSFDENELKIIIEKDGLSKEYPVMLEVKPEVEVAIISAQNTPYMYNRGMATCFRAHSEGLQVIFSNKTNDFQSGDEPCIHTGGVLRHCDTGNRMSQNETYIVGRPGDPRKVMPSSGLVNAIFYDHFNNQDSIGRRLFFNVTPGDETNMTSNGVACE
ncbi:MAG: hypothetical protein CME65_04115 [Halobacteriovoraceae bacterium]|nr:hypothetical protein [Halobacteriovoraceae bacterium]|tara:strand:- start:25068 stop:25991 length:924 start_codon:yes stop_codon:yes gene_type:complete